MINSNGVKKPHIFLILSGTESKIEITKHIIAIKGTKNIDRYIRIQSLNA